MSGAYTTMLMCLCGVMMVVLGARLLTGKSLAYRRRTLALCLAVAIVAAAAWDVGSTESLARPAVVGGLLITFAAVCVHRLGAVRVLGVPKHDLISRIRSEFQSRRIDADALDAVSLVEAPGAISVFIDARCGKQAVDGVVAAGSGFQMSRWATSVGGAYVLAGGTLIAVGLALWSG